MEWIDTHCHLYAAEFDSDRHDMVKRAIDSGITKLMMPNIDLESIPGMIALSKSFPGTCYTMMGLHPCSVKEDYQETLESIHQQLFTTSIAGIGETGTDMYWDTTFRAQQIKAFEQQIEWSLTYDLPVIIHSRESLDLNIEIMEQFRGKPIRGIFHCFSGTTEQVRRNEHLGCKVGIGGVMTFKNSGLAGLIPEIPLHMIVLETDSPYLAPAPHRGQRNEPFFMHLVALRLAEILNRPLAEISQVTTLNAREVFNKLP